MNSDDHLHQHLLKQEARPPNLYPTNALAGPSTIPQYPTLFLPDPGPHFPTSNPPNLTDLLFHSSPGTTKTQVHEHRRSYITIPASAYLRSLCTPVCNSDNGRWRTGGDRQREGQGARTRPIDTRRADTRCRERS